MKPAEIEWINAQPYSKQFGDIYFSKEGGLEETRYVFLEHNGLPKRWENCRSFTIIETGFGTGLNFLATWQAWQKNAPQQAKLHYIAVEQFPLKLEDIKLALAAYPELAKLAKDILKSYPPLIEGFYPIELEDASVSLTLLWGDANDLLPQLLAKADAWYLDGFSPKKNPELWHDKIFKTIANLSHAETSFATFTAAGHVKKAMQQNGFKVEKSHGFGQKKEMLHGNVKGLSSSSLPAWFALPSPETAHDKISIIGGGVAGIACAYRLIKKGYQVDLFEEKPELISGASSNPRALLKPQISPNFNLADQFYSQGFFYSSQIIRNLQSSGFSIESELNGLLQLASNKSLEQRFHKINAKRDLPKDFAQWIEQDDTEQLCGIALNFAGTYFPQAGTVNIKSLCQAMLAACGDKLKVHIQQAITKLTHNGQNWQLYNKENQLVTESKTVIIANAAAASQLNVGQDFSVSPLPGQLSLVAANAKSQYLKIPLSYEGHITPVRQGLHLIGSTYRHGREQDLSESKHDHQRVASYLDNIAPQLALDFSHAKAWLGSRSVTPDHLPLVGAVADKLEFDAMYQKIAKGSNRISFAKASYLPNLYISVGHGSKGLSSSLLSAEVIACLIEGSSLPISAKVYQAIHPSRFWLRQLKRGQAK